MHGTWSQMALLHKELSIIVYQDNLHYSNLNLTPDGKTDDM